MRTDKMGGVGQHVEASAWMRTAGGYGRRSYRAYVPHPLKGWDPVLSADDLEALTAADRALISILSLPWTDMGASIADWMTARDESIRSSMIEGVVSTESGLAWARYLDAAGRAVSDENDALTLGAAKQITHAVNLGVQMKAGGTCRLDDVLDLHKALFVGTRDRAIGGVLRDEPIWVGPPGCLVDDATFVAPPPDRVPGLMSDLIEYLNMSRHPAPLKAAVAHAQFETIHPFEDGNGRTGRALIHTVLNAADTARGAVAISTTLSDNRRTYYDALHAAQSIECDRGDALARTAALRSWLRVFNRACQDAAQAATASARRVEAISARWQAAGRFRRDSAAARLLPLLPSMPVLDAEMVAKRLGISRKAARRALNSLESAGIVGATGGRRHRRYHTPDLVSVLRRMGPDGGPTGVGRGSRADASAAPGRVVPSRQQCQHVGVRSERRCWLPAGHAGQHRYPPAE